MTLLTQETRLCASCRYRVEYCTITMDDDSIINIFAVFPADDDLPEAIQSCPRCDQPLTRDSTSRVKHLSIEQERRCKSCLYPVIYQYIHVAKNCYGPLWLVTMPRGDAGDSLVPANTCPQCERELTLRSTENAVIVKPRPLDENFRLHLVGRSDQRDDESNNVDPSLGNLLPQQFKTPLPTLTNPAPDPRRSLPQRTIDALLFLPRKFVATLNDLLNPGHPETPSDGSRDWGNRFHR